MPILHVYVPEGLLEEGQKARLFEGLTQAVLRGEAARDTPKTRSITWIFLHEMKKGAWAVGGIAADALRFMVDIELPQGTMNDRRRARMVQGIHNALADVAGRALALTDSMIKIHEIPDGQWSAGGAILRLQDIVAYVRRP